MHLWLGVGEWREGPGFASALFTLGNSLCLGYGWQWGNTKVEVLASSTRVLWKRCEGALRQRNGDTGKISILGTDPSLWLGIWGNKGLWTKTKRGLFLFFIFFPFNSKARGNFSAQMKKKYDWNGWKKSVVVEWYPTPNKNVMSMSIPGTCECDLIGENVFADAVPESVLICYGSLRKWIQGVLLLLKIPIDCGFPES